ncbi:hypothetical protein B0H15DRAFT_796833 [Mycena belliarum]|uniref:Uncharacterized protein n=1 Tax=Mycena belliarum TaxID=1033014 RepID=A0AAD6UIH0_9AGAR|nr:hypothetical protein B0H15DRAFT_796833 [Mycena belliae]
MRNTEAHRISNYLFASSIAHFRVSASSATLLALCEGKGYNAGRSMAHITITPPLLIISADDLDEIHGVEGRTKFAPIIGAERWKSPRMSAAAATLQRGQLSSALTQGKCMDSLQTKYYYYSLESVGLEFILRSLTVKHDERRVEPTVTAADVDRNRYDRISAEGSAYDSSPCRDRPISSDIVLVIKKPKREDRWRGTSNRRISRQVPRICGGSRTTSLRSLSQFAAKSESPGHLDSYSVLLTARDCHLEHARKFQGGAHGDGDPIRTEAVCRHEMRTPDPVDS